jgi:hypothetical protein
MASLIVKWQKCGKPGCRCTIGTLHGPYFWLVAYISNKINDPRKGKYSWQYLGKNPAEVWKKLRFIDKRFSKTYELSDLNNKIEYLKRNRKSERIPKTIEPILKLDDAILDIQ